MVAALLHRAIGDQLTCVFVDHGMLRLDEAEQVVHVFRDQFDIDLVHVEAEERYLTLLDGVNDPEQKRRIIGEEFWKVFFEEATKLEGVKWLAQGTLYPDVIESGGRAGKETAKIKSHHNLIPFPEGVHFDLIEPLARCSRTRSVRWVRSSGFPMRSCTGSPSRARARRSHHRRHHAREARRAAQRRCHRARGDLGWDTDRKVWQYFAVLPDIRSVGVMGDERTYGHPIIIRAVASADAMTADWARLPHDLLAKMSNRIINEVEGINRVAYDITSKPPGTIEWE